MSAQTDIREMVIRFDKVDEMVPLHYGGVARVMAVPGSIKYSGMTLCLMTPACEAQEHIGYTPAQSCTANIKLEQLDQLIAALQRARTMFPEDQS